MATPLPPQNLQFFLKPFLVCLLVCFVAQGLMAQNNWDHENYQDQYKTSNTNQGRVLWQEAEWLIYVKHGGTGHWEDLDGYPPLTGRNSAYIEIQENDHIHLEEALNYQNNLTLMVCGELYIGTLDVSEQVPMVIVNSEDFVINLSEKKIYASATYISEIPVHESEVGFYLAKEGEELTDPANWVPGFNFSENTEDNQFWGNFDTGTLVSLPGHMDFTEGDMYQIAAYAISDYGEGFSPTYTFVFDRYNKNLEASEEDDRSGEIVNIINRIRLWICDDGKLTIGALESGNNALIHVDGNLIIETMNFGNNYCITGDGNISNSEGDPPAMTGNPDGKCDGFAGTLPIELVSFSWEVTPREVILKWETASEVNNDYFTLERSKDMALWEVVGFVEGAGFSNQLLSYSLADLYPQEGLTYYRLKQNDFDGRYEYFPPLQVMYLPGMNGLDFRVVKSLDNWVIGLPGDGSWQVEVYSLNGNKLHSEVAVNNLSIPAPRQTVVIRVYNEAHNAFSRVVI